MQRRQGLRLRLLVAVFCARRPFGVRRRTALSLARHAMARSYLIHFACFACRRSFKRKVDFGAAVYLRPCPTCSGGAIDLGRHFKPPKASDEKQWAKVEYLVESGFFFQHVHDDERHQVQYPDTLEEARRFVVTYRSQAWRERIPQALQCLAAIKDTG
jgi:hypothetical protein